MVGCSEHGNESSSFIRCGKMSWLDEELPVSQDGHCALELVNWLLCRSCSIKRHSSYE